MVLAKLSRPKLFDAVPGKRLIKKLNDLSRFPSIWIDGPGGSGKTTLVNNFIDRTKRNSFWVTLDKADNDPALFFKYLTILQKDNDQGEKGDGLPQFQTLNLSRVDLFSTVFFRAFFSSLPPGSILVFDDLQEILKESLTCRAILQGLNEIPENWNLIIISREPPPSAVSRLKLNQRLGRLSWKDLKLSLKESEMILKRKKYLSSETIRCIHEKSRGWIAGIMLLSETITENEKLSHLEKVSQESCFDYLNEEVFSQLDQSLSEIYLKTAFLSYVTLSEAEYLTGYKGLKNKLKGQFEKDHFVDLIDGHPEETYRYHPLFRDFLLEKSMTVLKKDELSEVRDRCADLLANKGEIETAASLLCENQDYEKLLKLILTHANGLYKEARLNSLFNLINLLPDNSSTHTEYIHARTAIPEWIGSAGTLSLVSL